ncbi:hypothetical protein GOBAR_AA12907 [Gossypium barbadense]|uniref:Protein kinase domain-containing protein n=1 Tax=Gossypium barbadense TaxID=3634 RepID=A0A2P5XWN6_GOSBA|nr:hypothetical protein GOBAR_AA12907 [Gossypium barbadense]
MALGYSIGNLSDNKDVFTRADKIDFKSWDLQLDKHLSKAWSRDKDVSLVTKKDEWEIDLAKLDIRHVIAHGTYGIVYRGVYDNQDVAFIGASMGTSNLKIPSKDSTSESNNSLPSRACCVVVEYLPGGTLKNFLIRNRRKKLAFKVVIQLALDLSRGLLNFAVKVLDWGEDGIATAAEAAALRASFRQEVAVWHKLDHPNVTKLSYLHSKKIVHRDVKTENMLLDARRNLKIADFGVARVEAQNPKDMTGETGTLGYMAPEVLDGKPYNRRCDVYSFGICLWEIYCCDMPYADLSFAEVSSAVVRQNLRPEIPRCCPGSLASIMRKCWDAHPDRRPDMDEVVRLLEAVDTSKGGGMIPDDQSPGCFCFTRRGP